MLSSWIMKAEWLVVLVFLAGELLPELLGRVARCGQSAA